MFKTRDYVHRGMTYRFVIKNKTTLSKNEIKEYFEEIDRALGYKSSFQAASNYLNNRCASCKDQLPNGCNLCNSGGLG